MKRICADCGRPMRNRRSCRHCFSIHSVLIDDENGVPLEDLLPAEDDYGDESDADSVYHESSEIWGPARE